MNAFDLLEALRGAVAVGDQAGAAGLLLDYVDLIARRPLPEYRRYAGEMADVYRGLFQLETHGEG